MGRFNLRLKGSAQKVVAEIKKAEVVVQTAVQTVVIPEVKTVIQRVEIPIDRIVERIVEVIREVPVEKVIEKEVIRYIEVPIEKIIEKEKQVIKEVEIFIPKFVDRIVVQHRIPDYVKGFIVAESFICAMLFMALLMHK